MSIDRLTPPPVYDFPPLSMPEFVKEELPGGIELYIYDNCDEEVSRLSLIWMAGVADTLDPAAMSVMGGMFQEGTQDMTGAEVAFLLESNGAWLKTITGNHAVTMTLHLLNHTADTVYPLLRSIITGSVFPEENLEGVKGKMASAKEVALRKPNMQAAVISRESLYGADHPLAHEITAEEILKVSREEVLKVYRDLILSTKPVLVLSGRVDRRQIDIISRTIGSIKFDNANPDAIVRKIHSLPIPTLPETVTRQLPDSLQTAVRITIPTIPRLHPEYEKLRFATCALGGFFGSLLMKSIREDKGYTYGIYASLQFQQEGCEIIISCTCDNRYTDQVIEGIWEEIEQLKTAPLSPEMISMTRNFIISNLAGLLETPFTVASFEEMLLSYGLPHDIYNLQVAKAQATTAEDVMAMASKYMLREKSLTALAGNIKQPD